MVSELAAQTTFEKGTNTQVSFASCHKGFPESTQLSPDADRGGAPERQRIDWSQEGHAVGKRSQPPFPHYKRLTTEVIRAENMFTQSQFLLRT